ncbi:MAG TPA: DUF3152 domain-containing protein [Jatrophihabitans sp.]|jgi:hypothetical protein|uniref:DUF3152 domain-containing protein n=1 Tax=Jatrophihabitans sp. TaxID=1932789 RepID=UPI002E090301|nr:DUF3152 domain-containing protein [Jatrophihabitans sp.]
MTVPRRRDPADDVASARDAVRRAGVTYGPRDSRRSPRDAVGDWMRDFVRRYGWRAYALPVLLVVTVAALMTTTTVRRQVLAESAPQNDPGAAVGGAGSSSPPAAGPDIALKNDTAAGANVDQTVLKAGQLPAGAAYTVVGKGTYRVLTGTSTVVGQGQLYRYSIDVENGITGIDLQQFQRLVVTTLADRRSWSGHGIALQRVDSGRIDFHVTLTSSMTIRKVCGYDIPVETSCYAPAGSTSGLDVNRVAFNDARWVRGSSAYLGDLLSYRVYMINHEDGHALGHMHAHQCLPGGLAPAMMQQTFGLRSAATRQMCQANPWPYPVGAAGAPGAEQQDTTANNEYYIAD